MALHAVLISAIGLSAAAAAGWKKGPPPWVGCSRKEWLASADDLPSHRRDP
jgi:hypothetical protein